MLIILINLIGLLFLIVGSFLTFKYNSQGLTGFGCLNGPMVDKRILFRARLGLILLLCGIILQGVGNLINAFYCCQY